MTAPMSPTVNPRRAMAENKIRRLPVVHRDGNVLQLLGLVSATDQTPQVAQHEGSCRFAADENVGSRYHVLRARCERSARDKHLLHSKSERGESNAPLRGASAFSGNQTGTVRALTAVLRPFASSRTAYTPRQMPPAANTMSPGTRSHTRVSMTLE